MGYRTVFVTMFALLGSLDLFSCVERRLRVLAEGEFRGAQRRARSPGGQNSKDALVNALNGVDDT